jgi:hypothetical protein
MYVEFGEHGQRMAWSCANYMRRISLIVQKIGRAGAWNKWIIYTQFLYANEATAASRVVEVIAADTITDS